MALYYPPPMPQFGPKLVHSGEEWPSGEEGMILVQAFNNGLSASQVLTNLSIPPAAGDFSGTELWTDSEGAGVGYFSSAPNGQMAYCNGVDTCIWGGTEMRCAAFITSTAAIANIATNPRDYTVIINNTKTNLINTVRIGSSVSTYPVAQSDTYVKATSKWSTAFWPYFATDPTKSLIGANSNNSWASANGSTTNQRFHIDLGAETIIKRIYYENHHDVGANTTFGVQNFTFWGSNEASAFAELTYGTDTNWTQLTTSQGTFDQHVASNIPDPKYITVTNTTAYRYYAFKFADNYGGATWMAVRRIELRTTTANEGTFAVGSPRALKGIKIYVLTPNITASSLTGKEWDGGAWANLTLTDNTDTGPSLGQTGTVAFSSTVTTSKPRYLEGYYLYWYQFTLSAGEAVIYHVTLDAPFQQIKDVWDGVHRSISAFYVYTTSRLDNTLNVNEDVYDSTDATTYTVLDSLGTSHYLEVGFTEKQTGLLINIPPGYENSSGGTTTVTVEYWDGETYTSVGTVTDKTLTGTVTFTKSGVISWNNSSLANEQRKVISTKKQRRVKYLSSSARGYPLYYYKIRFSAALDVSCRIYYVAGIAAPNNISGYKFPIHAADRLMLVNNAFERANEVLVSAVYQPDVWNGDDSMSIEVGEDDALIGGAMISAQYSSNLYNLVLLFKKTETWVLKWEQTETGIVWERFQISSSVGCPAPGTIKTFSVSFDRNINQTKMVAIWQGHDGIYISDGRSPLKISDDIGLVFDQTKTPHINQELLDQSSSFLDKKKHEYHWLWASGGNTTLDKEYVLDMEKWRWFEINRETGNYLQCGLDVFDIYGNAYAYGLIDTGFLLRLENGTDFIGTNITYTLQTGDQLLVPQDPFMETRVTKANLVSVAKNTDSDVTLTHIIDAATIGTDYSLSVADATHRLANVIEDIYSSPGIFHSFKFVTVTNEEYKGFEPLYFSVFYIKERDHRI